MTDIESCPVVLNYRCFEGVHFKICHLSVISPRQGLLLQARRRSLRKRQEHQEGELGFERRAAVAHGKAHQQVLVPRIAETEEQPRNQDQPHLQKGQISDILKFVRDEAPFSEILRPGLREAGQGIARKGAVSRVGRRDTQGPHSRDGDVPRADGQGLAQFQPEEDWEKRRNVHGSGHRLRLQHLWDVLLLQHIQQR